MSTAVRRSAARESFVVPPPEETCHALAGHSGARVVLHARHADSFVRKTASTPSHNARLLAQIEKQRDLARSAVPFPAILASGLDAQGCAFFDMAYVPGRTIADAVMNSTAFDAETVLAAVDKLLWLFRACRGEALAARAFHDKIDTIAGSVDGEAVRDCARLLHDFDWNGIPTSPSHGDLTLENIMLGTERNVVFIDCDAPWVSSYWLDIGKLFQDLTGHWCLRRLAQTDIRRANAIEKLAQLERLFRPMLEPDLAKRLPQLVALNLFRALPYATGHDTAAFICTRIRRVLEH